MENKFETCIIRRYRKKKRVKFLKQKLLVPEVHRKSTAHKNRIGCHIAIAISGNSESLVPSDQEKSGHLRCIDVILHAHYKRSEYFKTSSRSPEEIIVFYINKTYFMRERME